MKRFFRSAVLYGLLFGAWALQAEEKELLLCIVENHAEGVTVVNMQECNPFSEQKCLVLQLDEPSDLTVQVVTPMGKVVKKMAAGRFSAGEHCFYWDGRDNHGVVVNGGVYVYEIDLTPITGKELALLP